MAGISARGDYNPKRPPPGAGPPISSGYPSAFGPATPQLVPDGSGGTTFGQQTQFNMPGPAASAPAMNPYAVAAPPLMGAGGGEAQGQGGSIGMGDITGMLTALRGNPVPRETPPQIPGQVAAPTPTAQSPASSMAFAQYKDQSGRIGNAALRALKGQMTERGISGSGIEGALTADVLGKVAQGQGAAAYQQQRAAEDQAWEGEKLGYQGSIGQRGTDIGAAENIYGGDVTQRQQDINSQDMTQLAPALLSLLGRRY
jgi:hypothetical protein